MARWLLHPLLVSVARVLVLLLFLLTIAAGLWGNPNPERNLAPTMVWVIGWVGIGFVCALIGNLWAALHPLRTLYRFLELGPSQRLHYLPYPSALGAWPAVIALFAFAWAEHLADGAAVPFNLGVALLAYSVFTLVGMRVFGPEQWLRNAELFSVAFAIFGRFAPLEIDERRELSLRPPAVGLMDDRQVPFSLMVFVLVLLAGVTFDGFIETPLWADLQAAAEIGSSPVLATLGSVSGLSRGEIVASLGLLLFPLGFLIAFLLCCTLMAALGLVPLPAGTHSLWRACMMCASRFVLTLVPIAIAYHLAHYLSLLLTAGQRVIPLLSDPFGRGWDLFGTAAYEIDPGLLGVRAAWILIVVAIVCGHMLSVYLAHVVALDLASDRRRAIRGELPLLVLMVCYTMASLWILAQPIVG